MTTAPSWRLPAPPRTPRSWLPDRTPARTPGLPEVPGSAPARTRTQGGGGRWPIIRGANRPLEADEVRNADLVRLHRRAHEDPFLQVIEPFEVIYGGERVRFEVGERVVSSHPAVLVTPRSHFRIADVRKTDINRGVVAAGPKSKLVEGTVR